MDERIIVEPRPRRKLSDPRRKRPERLGDRILVEPWACVESSYVTEERNTILPGGKLLVVTDAGRASEGLAESFSPAGKPASITGVCAEEANCERLRKTGRLN